ncbi:MAG: 6,7-dimethyl-8-ribityllumazine synthase [Dehalococcoidia bacterium]|nr:6,7-dimethyl-8-ribityllumazine synthase [Dehalococcoidia bacterium]
MATEYTGSLIGHGLRLGVVVARFNEFITSRLLDGAREASTRHGIDPSDVDVAHVPGALEIPIIAKKMAGSGRYDAIVCLGAVVRGDTPHFDYVCHGAASGIAQVALETGVPVIFGVITADTMEQAIDRAGGKAGNKGADAAVTAIEMANLLKSFSNS